MNKIVIGILFLISINSCSDSSTESARSREFYPLKDGNYWNYRLIRYDSLGRITDSSLVLPEIVIGDTVIHSTKWYLINSIGLLSMINVPYVNKPDGFHIWDGDNSQIVYKYPAQLNDMFGDSVKVVGIDQKTSTAAGQFNCIVYQTMSYDQSIRMWMYTNTFVSPGIGKIKIEYVVSPDKIQMITSGGYYLDSYTLY